MEEIRMKVDPVYERIFEFLRVEYGMNRTEARRLLLDPKFIQCMNVEEEHYILMNYRNSKK